MKSTCTASVYIPPSSSSACVTLLWSGGKKTLAERLNEGLVTKTTVYPPQIKFYGTHLAGLNQQLVHTGEVNTLLLEM